MLIRVKAFPKSAREEVKIIAADKLEIKVKEKPANGLANARIRQILAMHFNVAEQRVKLVAGAGKPNKIFQIN